jgi:hypothetical protein
VFASPLPIGSLADLGTLVTVLYAVRHEIRPQLQTLGAGLVLATQDDPEVDTDQLADELNVDEGKVDALERDVVACGGEVVDARHIPRNDGRGSQK